MAESRHSLPSNSYVHQLRRAGTQLNSRTFFRGTNHTGKRDGMARTTHRSKTGRKVYAKRAKTGQFEDIQSYERAHGQDVKRSSAAERAAKKKASKKKGSKKIARKKAAKKK